MPLVSIPCTESVITISPVGPTYSQVTHQVTFDFETVRALQGAGVGIQYLTYTIGSNTHDTVAFQQISLQFNMFGSSTAAWLGYENLSGPLANGAYYGGAVAGSNVQPFDCERKSAFDHNPSPPFGPYNEYFAQGGTDPTHPPIFDPIVVFAECTRTNPWTFFLIFSFAHICNPTFGLPAYNTSSSPPVITVSDLTAWCFVSPPPCGGTGGGTGGGIPTTPGSGGANAFSFADRPGIGHYHATSVIEGSGVYSRSTYKTPSGGWDEDKVAVIAAAAGKDVDDLRVARDDRQTLLAVYTLANTDGSGPGVYLTKSQDDGHSWEDPVLAISGGKHPTVAVGQDDAFRTIVIAAVTSGTITGQVMYAGDTAFGDPFVFQNDTGGNLAVADDTFHIQQAAEGPGRWILHCLEAGQSATSHFWSGDDCRTWTKFS